MQEVLRRALWGGTAGVITGLTYTPFSKTFFQSKSLVIIPNQRGTIGVSAVPVSKPTSLNR